jgi:hypothetical protein
MKKRDPKPLARLRIAMDRKKRRELRAKIRAAMARNEIEAGMASE